MIGTTDNAAHIGGLITGLIIGALVALIAPQHDHAGRRAMIFLAAIVVFCALAVELARYHGVPLRVGRSAMF
jgi:multisubunit Na+/H+ antiporter MnhE subunit